MGDKFIIKYRPRRPVCDIRKNSSLSQWPVENKDKKTTTLLRRSILYQFLVLTFAFFLLWSITGKSFIASAPVFDLKIQAEAANSDEEAALRKELEEIEKQIAVYEEQLKTTQKEKATLQNKINELKTKAAKLNLQIKATNLALSDLKIRIDDTNLAINKTLDQIKQAQENLSIALQALYQLSQQSLLEVLLSSDQLSDYFSQTNALNAIEAKINNQLKQIKELKMNLDKQKADLEDKKDQTQKLYTMQILQKQELDETKKEQEQLLDLTKGKESAYQQLLTASQKRAAEIRNRLYELWGVKQQVTFGEALDIATWVASRTGVREALLLAVLTQESNLGKNVGTCNRPSDPPEKSWQKVMRPDSRDAFLQITKELGLDPNTTPISCPMSVGWGGAMGPAQFMPKTWLIYKSRIANITGHNPPNPWDIRDAFVAAALYLADHGATNQTYDAEWRAAMMYFSGSTNSRFRFYGDSVMALAKKYEADIQTIRQANLSQR